MPLQPIGSFPLWAILGLCTVGLLADEPEAGEFAGRRTPEWDQVFSRKEGWTGGDGMFSVDLQDGRVLWLFSDTWIGLVKDGKHAPGSTLVNNTVAIHLKGANGSPPAAEAVEFLWGFLDSNGKPTAWIRPEEEGKWFWLADGLVTKGDSGGHRLVLFLWRVERAGVEGVFNFQSAGGAVAVVENPGEAAQRWRIEQHDNPHAAVPMVDGQGKHEAAIGWGTECLEWEDESGNGFALIYGARRSGFGNEILVARAPSEQIEAFDRWEFWTGAGWSGSVADAKPTTDGVMNELSVSKVAQGGRTWYVLVSSEPLFGDRILMKSSPSPLGPWSEAKAVFRVPEVRRKKDAFTYAAKGHSELSAEGSLLVTYVVNSFDFVALVNDAEIYRPRFVRVPLAAVLRAEEAPAE